MDEMNEMNEAVEKEPFCPVKWLAGKVSGRLSAWILTHQISASPTAVADFGGYLGYPGMEEALAADALAQAKEPEAN